MSIGYSIAVAVLVTVARPAGLPAQLQIPSSDTVALRRFADTMSARFASRVAAAGHPLPTTLRVRFNALGDPTQQDDEVSAGLAAGVIRLDQVSIPTWTGIDSSLRREFETFAAKVGPERLFVTFWNWLAPAHELSHLVQVHWGEAQPTAGDAASDFESRLAFEVEAWVIAAAFYRDVGAVQELAEAAALLRSAIASISVPTDTTGWSPASAAQGFNRCAGWTRQRTASGATAAETYAFGRLCNYRMVLDALNTGTGTSFLATVRNVALGNDPSRWPRTCDAAADLLARAPDARAALNRMSRDQLTPARTTWGPFVSAARGFGLQQGNAALAQSCDAASPTPEDVLHRIVVRAWERLQARGTRSEP